MKLYDFYQFYTLEDLDIKKACLKDSTLVLEIELSFYYEYMGNGIRPEFDLDYMFLFKFSNSSGTIEKSEKYLISEYAYDKENDILSFKLNNDLIVLNKSEISIERISNDY